MHLLGGEEKPGRPGGLLCLCRVEAGRDRSERPDDAFTQRQIQALRSPKAVEEVVDRRLEGFARVLASDVVQSAKRLRSAASVACPGASHGAERRVENARA